MGRSVKTFLWFLLAGGLILSAAGYTRAARHDQQDQGGHGKKSANEKRKNDKELKKELGPRYKKWLDEDVI